jgi:Asp-tRNA(Asn)/Glu-tRNA(Gln) amidotransferase A subunit family amidase
LLEAHPDKLGDDVRSRLGFGEHVDGARLEAARAGKATWRDELARAFARVELIALPTLVMFPPPLDDSGDRTVLANVAVNLAGHPALALPVPASGPLPASLQLVGPDHSEEALLAAGRIVEEAVASL